MSMNNSSVTNEKLISTIMTNLKENSSQSAVKTLYNTIFNNTILPSLNGLPCNNVPRDDKAHHRNLAKAKALLRSHLPYRLAHYCTQDPTRDSLYIAINNFKYNLNADFHTLFNYK